MVPKDDKEPVPSRRGFFKRLAQEPVKQALTQHLAGEVVKQAFAPKPHPLSLLPQNLKAIPHVAASHGYSHVSSIDGVHSFKHSDGSTLELRENPDEKAYVKRSVWKHTSSDLITSHEPCHGTPLASLDNHLEAMHNPKPEWSRLRRVPNLASNFTKTCFVVALPFFFQGAFSSVFLAAPAPFAAIASRRFLSAVTFFSSSSKASSSVWASLRAFSCSIALCSSSSRSCSCSCRFSSASFSRSSCFAASSAALRSAISLSRCSFASLAVLAAWSRWRLSSAC